MNNKYWDISLYFSFWVFIWAIVWIIVGICNTKNGVGVGKDWNPIPALFFCLVENILILPVIIAFGASPVKIALFVAIMVISKIIPIYVIYQLAINGGIFKWNGTMAFIGVFVLYNLYLWNKGMDIIEIYTNLFGFFTH